MHKKTLESILFIFIVATIILSAINFLLIAARSEKIKEAARASEKENEPPRLELIKIVSASCKDCFDINAAIEGLKKAHVNITSERTLDSSSAEAKLLIKKYDIEKMPTVIVLGAVNKSSVVNLWNQNWHVEMANGTQVSSVYVAVNPPYVDVSGNIKGLVSLTHIVDESCANCASLAQLINVFKQYSVKFTSEETIDYTTSNAQALISKFGVQKIPAMVISNDIIEYSALAQIWPLLNATEKQGFYALHTTVPPYRDLTTNKIEGLASVIYLKDGTCPDCYDVQINNQLLKRNFAVVLANETTVDISSAYGQLLIKQYNLTKVPIILVSPDASAYERFVQAWEQVGDIASDDWYVMRKPEVLGTYKDLSTGQVIKLGG